MTTVTYMLKVCSYYGLIVFMVMFAMIKSGAAEHHVLMAMVGTASSWILATNLARAATVAQFKRGEGEP